MRLLATLVGLALATAACESGRPVARPAPIKPGICVADESQDQGNVGPDLSSIVDCRRPHTYEVYDIIDLPAKALTGTSRQERIDNRDDLALPRELRDDSRERRAFEEFAERRCARSLLRVTGYDGVQLRRTSAPDARVVPALRGINAPWYTVMPEDEWLSGRRQLLCSARFEDPDHTEPGRTPVKPRVSADDRMILPSAAHDSLPVDFRQCRGYDNKRRQVAPVSCNEPHVDEALLTFEATGVFGTKFVKSIERRPTPQKFDRFDEACADAFVWLLGPDYDTKALRGFGSVARRWTEKGKPVRCSVGPVKFRTRDLPPGSLVGTGAKKINLIRAK